LSLVLDRPGIELSIGKVLVAFPVKVSPMLALPDENTREEKDNNANSSNGIEDVGDADSINPRHQSEDENRAKQVSGESEADKGIPDNLTDVLVVLLEFDGPS
jgi:hypothetical protein